MPTFAWSEVAAEIDRPPGLPLDQSGRAWLIKAVIADPCPLARRRHR